MLYEYLADGLVVVHLAFIAFVVLGGVLALRWPWLALVHLPAAGWGAFVELSGRVCPLTPLENSLRVRAGQAAYSGGFIEQYLLPIVYPGGMTPAVQFALGVIVVGINVLVYLAVARRYFRKRRRASSS